MKISSAEFVKSAVKKEHWLTDGMSEIALIGRSNVGKSSLINTLVNRKGLAKTSSQPGKTRTINFYRINSAFYLVDLPGFGYAKVSRSEKKSWEGMVGSYLNERENLKGVLVILDPRRDATETEEQLYQWIERLELPVTTVFTKVDKLSKNKLVSRIASIKKALPIGSPVLFSSHTGEGKTALGKRIYEMLSGTDGTRREPPLTPV
jgi:GTP-binding protein